MHDLLAACVDLETLAIELYGVFAETTADEELRSVFDRMQAEERQHLEWWEDLERRVDAGELLKADPGTHVTPYMRAIVATLRGMLTSDMASFSDEDRLSLAASLEFFALDPVFSQLIDASDPEPGGQRHTTYEEHVALLASTMEARDSWVLAPHIALLRDAIGPYADGETPRFHDPATGLPLRAVAEKAIDELCGNPSRRNEPVSLALVEILGLQSAYDYSHALGERTLLRLVSIVNSLLRLTDLLVRPEGNHFAIVMPSTSSAAATTTMRSIAQAVVHEGESFGDPLNAVASVVTLPPTPSPRPSGRAAFSAAEAQLAELLASGESLGAIDMA